jgi:hypothetical protein
MTVVRPFSDEQARILVNLRQGYEVWIEAARALFAMPYDAPERGGRPGLSLRDPRPHDVHR